LRIEINKILFVLF